MMTEMQIANTLALVGVLGLWSLVAFKIWPAYRVDSFRQKLFEVRDRMFDFAAEGNIAFNEPAYELLRRQMNGLIRYAHRLTVFQMLLTALMPTESEDEQYTTWQHEWDRALAKLKSTEIRERMQAFHDESMSIAVKHLVFGSPVLWLAIAVTGILLGFHGAAMSTRQLLRAAANKVLRGPLDRRFIEEAAIAA